MAVVETLNTISETMDKLIDFAVNDDVLAKSFENYIVKNKIEVQRQSEITALLVEYILDGKMEDNSRVLDYYSQKTPVLDTKIVNALKRSFISVFRVNKILKNAYQCTCLANEYDFELIPLVKMINLKAVGLYDYIKARMIEIDNTFYILEIFDCFGQYREYNANVETVKCLIKYPESQTMYNKEKLDELKTSVEHFNKKFLSVFNKDEIVLSNTVADSFIKEFNQCLEGDFEIAPQKYENCEFECNFIECDNTDEDFIKNAQGGFSNSKIPYDIGFFTDFDLGLFVVPNLGCVNKILGENSLSSVENGLECIKNFVLSNNVSPNLLIKKSKEFGNFIEIISKAFNKDFKDIREIISIFKQDWLVYDKFSPTIVLYNSKTFAKIIGIKEEEKKKEAPRNAPCPCGSGKKYKFCCGKTDF